MLMFVLEKWKEEEKRRKRFLHLIVSGPFSLALSEALSHSSQVRPKLDLLNGIPCIAITVRRNETEFTAEGAKGVKLLLGN